MFKSFSQKADQPTRSHGTDLYAALDKIQALIWFEPTGQILDANANFLATVGYDKDEIVGQHHSMFAPDGFAETAEYKQLWEDLRHGKIVAGKFQRVNKAGDLLWLEASYNPLFDDNGDVYAVVKFAIDITETRTLAVDTAGQIAAISRSQAVIEFEPNGTILHANDNFCAALGYRLEEIKGKHHSLFVDGDEVQSESYTKFWDDLANGTFKADEFKRFGKSGNEIWIQATYNPILDANGKVFKVVKFATDITARVMAVNEIAKNLARLAEGDLTGRVSNSVDGDFEPLRDGFNGSVTRLGTLIAEVQTIAHLLDTETETIADSATKLAQRAEAQAVSLEETNASMEEMSVNIREMSQSAVDAANAAEDAAKRAAQGVSVAGSAVEAMDRIEEGSAKISDIITVIESIAFQTNLLALNAAVEAARAGDSGKGFAVVAGEVRTLAQRSSEAAKDITDLIRNSSVAVTDGARLVRDAGEVLSGIENAFEDVSKNITNISSASQLQTDRVSTMSSIVGEIDSTTQKNAQMADQSSTTARSLSSESKRLSALIATFNLDDSEQRQDEEWQAIAANPESEMQTAQNF